MEVCFFFLFCRCLFFNVFPILASTDKLLGDIRVLGDAYRTVNKLRNINFLFSSMFRIGRYNRSYRRGKNHHALLNKFTLNLTILALLLMTRKFMVVLKFDKKYVHDFLIKPHFQV